MLRTLIVEDDFVSRKILQTLMAPFGECDVATDGDEALEAFIASLKRKEPYHLICLDIGMPGLDGHGVLAAIRQIEESQGLRGLDRVKVIMTTASADRKDVATAFRSECDAYLIKPIEETQLRLRLQELGLVS